MATLSFVAMMATSPSADAARDALVPYQWKARVLLVLASQAGDPKLARQRTLFKAMGSEARERDLALVEVIGDTVQASQLRRRFGVEDGAFHAVLIGKDGGDKFSSGDPLGPNILFPLIDAMPMRRQDMHRKS